MKLLYKKVFLLLLVFIGLFEVSAQQDPQFTQYMYNTMTVNPGYAGSQGHTVITLLGRTQWVGFDGAPDTQSLSIDTPLSWQGVGLGLNVMNDEIGPAREIYADGNISYAIKTSEEGRLSLGLKLGARFLDVDFSRANAETNVSEDDNINNINEVFPTVGAGIYYYTNKFYVGAAIPNFLKAKHYDQTITNGDVAAERLHLFAIAGYVFDLSDKTKFKPAALLKAVSGAPLSVDVSANFLFNDKFHAGLAWRWDDSVSALLGYQLSRNFMIGYAYDQTTSQYRIANNGTHELLLRYDFLRPDVIISPRFF